MKLKGKILVTDSIHPLFIEEMQKFGFEVDYLPEINQKEVEEIISGYTGLIINTKTKAHKNLIDKAAQLKFIGRIGSGMEIIDTEYAKKKKIACFNSPEGNRDAVAEHAIGMLLSMLNNIHLANEEVKKGLWKREPNRGVELGGKTVGIIGYGNTGSSLAKKLKGFDLKILAYDKYKSGFSKDNVKESIMQDLYNHADVLSIHLPLTPETENLVDFKFLNSFRKNIFFINTSRGKIVKTVELLKAIESGKVLSAALDVLENENLKLFNAKEKILFGKLVKNKKVLLTPHIAGWTKESKEKIARTLIKKIKKILR